MIFHMLEGLQNQARKVLKNWIFDRYIDHKSSNIHSHSLY